MTTTQDDGGPAWPVREQRDRDGNGITEGHPGMSLRDWLAGQALAGFGPFTPTSMLEEHPDRKDAQRVTARAKRAYQLADAMLAARKEPSR